MPHYRYRPSTANGWCLWLESQLQKFTLAQAEVKAWRDLVHAKTNRTRLLALARAEERLLKEARRLARYVASYLRAARKE